MYKKVGLLLGSFDPPHIGHLHAAKYALNIVDEVWIVPAWHNPWKTNQTQYTDRYNMCKLLFTEKNMYVSNFDYIVKSDYTYQGLQELLKYNNAHNEYYIIGGTDIAQEIPHWKNGEWILKNFKVIEVPRPGYTDAPDGVDCSSTMIKKTKEFKKYTNKAVTEYINTNKLYETLYR